MFLVGRMGDSVTPAACLASPDLGSPSRRGFPAEQVHLVTGPCVAASVAGGLSGGTEGAGRVAEGRWPLRPAGWLASCGQRHRPWPGSCRPWLSGR